MSVNRVSQDLEAAYTDMEQLRSLFADRDPSAQQKALRVLIAFSLYDKTDQLWNEPDFDTEALRTHISELVEIAERTLTTDTT